MSLFHLWKRNTSLDQTCGFKWSKYLVHLDSFMSGLWIISAHTQALMSSENLTLSFSCLLLLGPFHWTMVLPMSNRNTSPRLKLSQLISTWNTFKYGALSQHSLPCAATLLHNHQATVAHLFCNHSFLSFNMKQSLHIIRIGFDVPHTGRNSSFLIAEEDKKVIFMVSVNDRPAARNVCTHIIPCLK